MHNRFTKLSLLLPQALSEIGRQHFSLQKPTATLSDQRACWKCTTGLQNYHFSEGVTPQALSETGMQHFSREANCNNLRPATFFYRSQLHDLTENLAESLRPEVYKIITSLKEWRLQLCKPVYNEKQWVRFWPGVLFFFLRMVTMMIGLMFTLRFDAAVLILGSTEADK